MGKDMLSTTMAYLEGTPFRVEDFPWSAVERDGPSVLKKGIAYRYKKKTRIGDTDLITAGLFPYRGVIKDDFSYSSSKVGFWSKKISHEESKLILVRPRTIEEKGEYRLGKEQDLVAATLNHDFTIDQFTDNLLQSDIGMDAYIPPVHLDDDPLNMFLKMCIRLKHAPFEPYGARLKALAVDKKKGVEGSNIVNNSKRGFRYNRAMSPTKFMQYCDTWQLEPAFIIKDIPGAMHKMGIPKDKMLVIYPSGIPFDINQDDLIDISPMVTEAISETLDYETHPKKNKRSDKDDELEDEFDE